MLFSSPVFLFIFLPLVFFLYYLIRADLRNIFLLLASLFFYTWGEPKFVAILLLAIGANYILGLLVFYLKFRRRKLSLLALLTAVLFNLGFLIYFKYRVFILTNILLLHPVYIPSVVSKLFDSYNFFIPLALSFFAFHAIAYQVDVFKGRSGAEKNPIRLFLYFLLFPHLLAGPIVRYGEIATYLKSRLISLDLIVAGVSRFIVGLSKKLLIADRLSPTVNEIFAIPAVHINPSTAWLGIVCFSLQIYFDFSAYSDMAIGLALIFGFKFPENFNYPYTALSIRDFWRRWHITLSNWFRDYLYIPLGGNRVAIYRHYFNLIAVFLLVGLWHGPSWNFVIWGLIHGVFLVFERLRLGKILGIIWVPYRRLYVFIVLTTSWVFFRVDNLDESLTYLSKLFGLGNQSGVIYRPFNYFSNNELWLIIGVGVFLALNGPRELENHLSRFRLLSYIGSTAVIRSLGQVGLIFGLLVSIMVMSSQTYQPFLYFRF